MEEFWILILVAFSATNSLEKAESVQLEETPLKIIDEIFGEGWWDNEKDKEWHKLTLEHNFHYEMDRQNTQIGQIEPNSNIAKDEEKLKIIDKFHAIKDEFNHKEKLSAKEWAQIEDKIAKHLKVSRTKIYKWKKEFGLSQKKTKNEQKHLIEKFDQRKAEFQRAGFKNSFKNQLYETVAKELGLNFKTIYRWKNELGQTEPNHKHSRNEQKELMKRYYKIKDNNPLIYDKDIAKSLNISRVTLCKWKKKQFKRQQFHPNYVDGNSVEENAAANVQEIQNINSGSI